MGGLHVSKPSPNERGMALAFTTLDPFVFPVATAQIAASASVDTGGVERIHAAWRGWRAQKCLIFGRL
jgi:hypothetical protein